MLKGIYILGNQQIFDQIYAQHERKEIAKLVDVETKLYTRDEVNQNPSLLHDVDVVFSGWGCVNFNEELLTHANRLKFVFYGAGSIRNVVSESFWEKGIRISSAWVTNGIPVAEYTLAQILFSLKQGFKAMHEYKSSRGKHHTIKGTMPGAFRSTVGIVSLGVIGRMVCELLKSFSLNVIAYDPYATEATAKALGVTLVGLDELFKNSDVVSLHTPWLPETVGMVTGEHFASMKPNSTFINTARGAVIKEAELIEVLKVRHDLTAVLDVTYPAEPPAEESALYDLDNVVLTPHIAGSTGPECQHMGQTMLEELQRYLAGEKLLYEVNQKQAATMA